VTGDARADGGVVPSRTVDLMRFAGSLEKVPRKALLDLREIVLCSRKDLCARRCSEPRFAASRPTEASEGSELDH